MYRLLLAWVSYFSFKAHATIPPSQPTVRPSTNMAIRADAIAIITNPE